MASKISLSNVRPLRLDTTAAIIGLVVALLLFPLRFFASQIYINTIPIVIGVGSLLYLAAVRQSQDERTLPVLSTPAAMALPSIVVVGMAAMVLVTMLQEARTTAFFVISGVVGTLLFGQILFTSDRDFNHGLILFQLVLFALVFRLLALYATPGFVGIDVWTHMTELASAIYTEESLGAIANDKHFASPFFHLLVVASALVYDVSLRLGLFLSVGIVMPLSILLVYATANLLVPSRWATLAGALFAVSSHAVLWGIHLIPTSLGLVFFLGLLYALLRVMRIEYTGRDFTLLILLSVAIILTHQVSTFIMLVLLGAAFLAQIVFMIGPLGLTRLDTSVFQTKKPVNLIGLVVFNFGFAIFVWSLTPFRQDSFLGTVLTWFGETVSESAGFLNLASPGATDDDVQPGAAAETTTTLIDQIVPYVNELGFLLLLSFMLIGCLYVVHRRRAEQSVFTLALGSGIMLFFVLGLPMFGIRNFIPTRWFAFLYALMAILGAIGLRTLSRNLSATPVLVVLLLVALIFPGGMMLASASSIDNPVFEEQNERLAYDEDEIAAAYTVGEMTGSPTGSEIREDQQLYTDHPYQTMVMRTHSYPQTTSAEIPAEGGADHEYTLYRTAQSEGSATYFRDENGHGYIATIDRHELCQPAQSTVYDNGNVQFCTPSPALE
ncbi:MULTISPECIES: glycosyltransferase family protein [Natrialbaceae]|uniref:hypothetical protein n=1 Tax=Natrialbaceae TaxID=1644061 RepID=UPI00207CB571|nr:hypothetical protein [Natronococcus sp. CG52]